MEKSTDLNKSNNLKASPDGKPSSKDSRVNKSASKNMTPLHEFKEDLEKHTDTEEKLKMSIEFMRHSLSQKGTPRFRDFWEAKKLCSPLFKEKINPAVKAKFWSEYTELSSEAKRLKEILDEQSSFAVEQIELALKAIQEDLTNHEEHIKKLTDMSFPKGLFFVKDKLKDYERLQKHISFYVTLSARTKDLRKEIIQTEMRVRSKNKLLEKLSKLADEFLPEKKKLIKKISDEFTSDVEKFASKHFDLEKNIVLESKLPFFKLRDEIKAFQSFAKFISLNSHSFSASRLVLSNCWSTLKEAEKKLRSEQMQKKKEIDTKTQNFKEKLKAAEVGFDESKPKSKEVIFKKIEELMKELKENRFSKAEFIYLKKEIQALEEKLMEPFYKSEKEVREKAQHAEEQALKQIDSFKEKYLNLISNSKNSSLHDLKLALEELESTQKTLKLDFADVLKCSEIQKELFELILLKQEDEINVDSEDTESLENILVDWENFREETRSRLESYRKEMGGSGFDFEKAMLYRDHMDIEKDRLDRIVEKIEGIEERL